MKTSIPIIRSRELEAFIPGDGREREFLLTPAFQAHVVAILLNMLAAVISTINFCGGPCVHHRHCIVVAMVEVVIVVALVEVIKIGGGVTEQKITF